VFADFASVSPATMAHCAKMTSARTAASMRTEMSISPYLYALDTVSALNMDVCAARAFLVATAR
jgi:hypothetical protein